jgi:uncharacterized circularly permuted ATP-grasp superfamily protein/uncharacterized alpha-E superfamily protein
MRSDVSTVAGPLMTYAPPPGVFDEVYAAPKSPRPHWRRFLDTFQRVPPDVFSQRSAQADRLLLENGVTYNVFGDGKESQRPWRLDLLPFVIGSEEWSRLEHALDQRARLLDLVIRDLYGPQRLIRQRHLPPEIIFAHPGFVRPFHGLRPESESALLLYSAELARSADGQWWVMADRTEAPPGAGYALENRIVTSRTIPQLMHRVGVQRLAPFFIRLQNALKKRAVRPGGSLRIVLLTSGTRHPHYFEDVYLARYLGLTLVEGGDLATRDERVFVKTLGGLLPVDVIFSRGSEAGLDPLELGGGAPHGVPGLLQAIRKGHVQVTNTPGCALVESPVFMAFLPGLCRHLLGETLAAPSIATWWCGQAEHRQYVLDHLEKLVLKPAFQRSGGDEFLPELLSSEAVAQLRAQINDRPYDFVAQEKVARSAAPVWHNGGVRCGHVAVRTFLVSDEAGYSLLPGGLIRIAPTTEPMELSITAGDGSKDLWVLADGPVEPVTLLVPEDQPVPLRRTGAMFPSRVADDLFWLGQSLDRADFLCRLLRSVVERLTAESEEDLPELPVLVRALAYQGQIEPGFAVDDFSEQLPALEEGLPRAVFDSSEPRGITQAVSEMLRLASEARDWLSPDTWRTIHQVATEFLYGNAQRRSDLADLLATLNQVLVDLASVSGLIQDGMIRGPAWRFLDMGRRIERGRDTIGIVRSTLMSGKVADKSVLRALLEVLDCRMTYRSRYLDNLQQNAVMDLAVTDETNPHSVAFQALTVAEHVDALPRDMLSPLRTEEKRAAMAAVHAVRMITPDQLAETPPTSVEEVLATLDQQFRTLSETLTRTYLLHSGVPRQITEDPPP